MPDKVRIPFVTDTILINGSYYPEDSFVSKALNEVQEKFQVYNEEKNDIRLGIIDEFV